MDSAKSRRRGDWRKSALIIRTLPGYLHAKSNNSKNLLLRPIPNVKGPIAVEVLVESDPQIQFEHAGPVRYYDDDNYVSLFREVLGKKQDSRW